MLRCDWHRVSDGTCCGERRAESCDVTGTECLMALSVGRGELNVAMHSVSELEGRCDVIISMGGICGRQTDRRYIGGGR
jgi:hypothetical protein